jgi:hypothetical protein
MRVLLDDTFTHTAQGATSELVEVSAPPICPMAGNAS